MSRNRCTFWILPFLFVAVAACAVAGIPALDQRGGPDDLEKKKAELAKIESKIEAELSKIESKYREEIEKAYLALTKDSGFRTELGRAFEGLAKSEGESIAAAKDDDRRARRKLEKAIDGLLDDKLGRYLSTCFRNAAASYVVELYDREKKTVAGGDVVEGITLDFEGMAFEEFFSKHRAECFSSLARLEAQRAELERELAELVEIAEAAKAGVPRGMVRIPAGKHQIGIDDSDIKNLAKNNGYDHDSLIRLYYSSPSFQAEVEEFFIDRNEVTNEWYLAFVNAVSDAEIPLVWEDEAKVFNAANSLTEGDEGYRQWVIPEGFMDRPVSGLSARGAMRFAAWMGRRLPTEFEWEAAARYGNSPRTWWSFGDFDPNTAEEKANIDINVNHPGRASLRAGLPGVLPVGTFQAGASPLGINDLVGNVQEMTTSSFKAYPGFKNVSLSGRNAMTGDFNQDLIVLRGGDCLKREVMATSVVRLDMAPGVRATLVGFRTAASATRGLDTVRWMNRNGELDRFRSDIAPLSKDVQQGRPTGTLDLEDPERFTAVSTPGLNAETGLPQQAKQIVAINRDTVELRNMNTLRALARDGMVCLGALRVDVPVLEPKLEPGLYFVYWQNEYLPEETEPAEGEAGGEEKPKKGKGKDAAKAEEPEPIPEAFVFQLKSTDKVADAVRLEKGRFVEPVIADAQPTRIVPKANREEVEVVFSFPTTNKKRNFVVSLNLQLEPGTAATLR